MSVIAAVNLVDRLVLLEDGRELKITQFYKACSDHRELGPLTARDRLYPCCRVDDHEGAEVFVVQFGNNEAPALIEGADCLIVEIAAISLLKNSQIN